MTGFAEYDQYDALGLAELVAAKEVTPSELLEEAIARMERHNPLVNAVVYQQLDQAREAAKQNSFEGPFAGVPFLLKDLMAEQAGHPSTNSCKLLADWRADRNSEIVSRFERAGLNIFGRTNTPEFGIYAVTEPAWRGATRNPWNTEHTPGGSSGGSAAAVAARIVPMAHGGDGGGSIRIPSAHCGLVGLKPTRARNPSGPLGGEHWGGQVVEHVISRSVRDSAASLDATCGPEPGAPYQVQKPMRPFLEEVERDPGQLRIAYTAEPLFGNEVHDDCKAALEDAVALAEELGHIVEPARPTFDKPTLVRAYLLNVAAGTATDIRLAGERSGRKPRYEDVEPATWLLKLIGEKVSAAELDWHRDTVQRAGHEIAELFGEYDLLLTPTAAQPPVPIGTFALKPAERLQLGLLKSLPLKPLLMLALDTLAEGALAATPNTMLFNLTGAPAISLPLFWNEAGLPIGTQWVGRFGDEATLLRLAGQMEKARPWAQRKPPLVDAPTT